MDLQYDLKPEELQKLMANKVSGKGGVSVDARLAIINEVIGKDFDTKLTKDMLETKELVSLDLKPEVRQEVEAPFIEQERRIEEQQRLAEARAEQRRESERIERDPNAINGREIQAILGNKEVNFKRGSDNSQVTRCPGIEKWAQDMYHFMADKYGEDNIAAFVVHLDETLPHIHCTLLPITEKNKFSYNKFFGGNKEDGSRNSPSWCGIPHSRTMPDSPRSSLPLPTASGWSSPAWHLPSSARWPT